MKFTKSVSKFLGAVTHPGEYVKAEVQKVLVNAQHKLTEVMVQLIILFTIVLAALVTILFASITLALWINQLLESSFQGFLIVTGMYFILFLLLFFLRKHKGIKTKLNVVVKKIANPEDMISSEEAFASEIGGEEGGKGSYSS